MAPPFIQSTLGRLVAAAAVLATTLTGSAAAETPEIAKRKAAERKAFTDAEIIDGFFKLTFGAEYQVTGRADRIRKFDEPIRIYIENKAKPDRSRQVVSTVTDIKNRVQNLDIGMVGTREEANMVVTLVRDRELNQTLRTVYGKEQARSIQKSLEPQCLSSFRRDSNFRIAAADVILVTDAGDFIFFDCAYEELLQALGPINDDSSVRWSMFNDKVSMGFFGIYDQYILNILYHPRIRAGMTRAEVQAALPDVLPEVRAFVAKTNDLK